jgi:hypothetical protein
MGVLGCACVIVSAIVVSSLAAWLHARIQQQQLAAPVLNGVPLPAVDDPRWAMEGGRAELGDFRIISHYVFLGRDMIGEWSAYCQAVRAPLKARAYESLQERALKQIEEAP